MKAKLRFIIAACVLGLLMTGPFAVTALLLYADSKDAERAAFAQFLLPRLPLGGLITTFGFIAGLMLLRGLFQQYVQGLLRMAETLRLMLGANRNFRVTPDGPPEVRELARAANDLAQQRDELLTDVDAQIRQAKATVEEEKNRLAALMSELALGVVVCNLDGRILLYNSRARLQFKALAQGPTSTSGGALIGLGRSIFSILERGQITHSLENIQQRLRKGSAAPTANFITATRGGALLRCQMAPVLRTGADSAAVGVAQGANMDNPPGPLSGKGGDEVRQAGPAQEERTTALPGDELEVTGYVLTIENITRNFEREAERDQALQALTDGNRAALGNIRAAVETLIDTPDMEADYRERFTRVIADEAAAMSQRLDATMSRFADSLKTRWPLEDVLAIDILAAAARRIEDRLKLPIKHEEQDASLWMRVDSFSLIQAITFLAARLQDHYAIRELRLRLSAEGKMVFLDLIWSGTPVSSETLYTWELEPMTVGAETSPLTLRDVIDRHGGEIWYQRDKAAHRAFFRMVVPAAVTPDLAASDQVQHLHSDSRPEYYDFDLFAARDAAGSGIDLDRKLSELTYSVFDTETTGLEPSSGDEIIQMGAVRVVNNRLLRQEVFDQLVDPGIPLKPAGIPIHGITEAMVHGQPKLDVVLPAFHEFCAETVLVAHNAAFDMRFFQLKEDSLGVRFTQPVLDTLLLSAVIHPNQESHRLETIAERLGINVIGRHTALGDAFVTGEVFLKMVPLLADMGIVTLRQALDAAQKTYFARITY
ncbi:exonuclease domain-containing protein [Sulfuritalea sp.]|uniref:3'-5' exonuclease n=1 Tax=Sulfuritalea sp. TaxID=2480090 RepID=UPI001AD48DC7|nr:exonuclease domain-containing protein [Sulfuritalea sp.]MBN8477017.1 DNA polymerase III subunit epsilon [Sulfuritalea sp.]